jgi:hypothetical protein
MVTAEGSTVLAAAGHAAPRELLAKITTIIKALSVAETPAAEKADAAAAEPVAGRASCLLLVAAMLLEVCVRMPEQLPAQQRLALLGRGMALLGTLIAEAFEAPAVVSPLAMQRLIVCNGEEPGGLTLEGATKRLHALIRMCARCIGSIGKDLGPDEFELPGDAAAAEEAKVQLANQLSALFDCVRSGLKQNCPEVLASCSSDEESEQGDDCTSEEGGSDYSDIGEGQEVYPMDLRQHQSSSTSQQLRESQQRQQQEEKEEEETDSACSSEASSSSPATAGAAGAGAGAAMVGPAEMQDLTRQLLSVELGQQLQRMGSALVAQLPQPLWCCNPSCSSLGKLSELALVGGKSCVCSGCRTARFCSRQCLQACWMKQLHRGVCKRIAAAAQQQQQQQEQQQQGAVG